MDHAMSKPRVCVLRAPGTNCDVETAHAFEISGAEAERVHLFRLLESPQQLANFQMLCIPGGFSYGDDIGAGVIFARQLRHRLKEALLEFLQKDNLVLGICNGFQVLLKSGILPHGASAFSDETQSESTLTWNTNGKYTARWVRVKNVSPQNVFLRGIDEFDVPIAHAEGRLTLTEGADLQSLREQNQIGLCYCESESADDPFEKIPYPANPNGSVGNIAGLSDTEGRVLGLMPHPERFIHATQHPQWTRLPADKREASGLKIFQNAVAYYG